ncbi:MAG: hypothetical protein OEZ65_08830 [Gemmatimonadota bacterium]|nr:hypothetical protein [Gemmatimonadota bacterium]MDH5759678.1 hypothetical protein [Gemmatimonadota bacterium]
MIRSRSRGVAAVFLVSAAMVSDPVSGQTHFLMGGGLSNPMSDLGQVVDGGYNGRIGLEIGFPMFPLSIRGEGEIHRFPGAAGVGHLTVPAASASAVFSFGGLGMSPYAVAGIGKYRFDYSASFGEVAASYRGFHGGFGVHVGAMGAGAFIEARFVHVQRPGGPGARYIPLTLGIKL